MIPMTTILCQKSPLMPSHAFTRSYSHTTSLCSSEAYGVYLFMVPLVPNHVNITLFNKVTAWYITTYLWWCGRRMGVRCFRLSRVSDSGTPGFWRRRRISGSILLGGAHALCDFCRRSILLSLSLSGVTGKLQAYLNRASSLRQILHIDTLWWLECLRLLRYSRTGVQAFRPCQLEGKI